MKTTGKKKKAGVRKKKKTTAAAGTARRGTTAAGAARRGTAAAGAARRGTAAGARRGNAPAHAYQEGSVQSVGARATGTDREDRSGDGTRRPSGKRAPAEKGRDSFVSSEVGSQTSVPGKDPRTRS